MLNRFDPLLPQLFKALPRFSANDDDLISGPYWGRIEYQNEDKMLFFGKPDMDESTSLCLKIDPDSGLIVAIAKVCVFVGGVEQVVYKYSGRLFYRSIVLVEGKTSIQFHWSVDTGQLESIGVSCLVCTNIYEFIGSGERLNAFGGMIPGLPSTLKGETEILGIPIVWKKDDVQECAEQVIRAGLLKTEDLLAQMTL